MARRKHREGESLQKVLGVPALFSTAYGNVGSSIYYALGLVALWALGVTPVVFLLTGLLFVTTAWSYAEATAMVPEAGGSSSFGRRAFNEFVSFGAGWALMLDYIVTVAISAYFVPNYLAVFWPALKTQPYNSIGGIVTIIALVAHQRHRHQGGGAPQHHPRAAGPRHPGPAHGHGRRAPPRAQDAHRPGAPRASRPPGRTSSTASRSAPSRTPASRPSPTCRRRPPTRTATCRARSTSCSSPCSWCTSASR